MKEDGTPLSTVADSRREAASVSAALPAITAVSSSAPPAALPAKNTEHRKISSGNRPLHGANVLVSMAISRSRGESMMRQPVTPQALHPNPMHMPGSQRNAQNRRPLPLRSRGKSASLFVLFVRRAGLLLSDEWNHL